VLQRDTFPGGPQAFFADVAQLTFMSRNSIFLLQTLLGDGVVVSKGPFRFVTMTSLLNKLFLSGRSTVAISSGNLFGSSCYHAYCGVLLLVINSQFPFHVQRL
jgi:hypothetical protein